MPSRITFFRTVLVGLLWISASAPSFSMAQTAICDSNADDSCSPSSEAPDTPDIKPAPVDTVPPVAPPAASQKWDWKATTLQTFEFTHLRSRLARGLRSFPSISIGPQAFLPRLVCIVRRL